MYSITVLMGRLVADPELRHTANDIAVSTFRIAVDRPYKVDGKEVADFFNVVAWRKLGEFAVKYFKKGKPILIQGHFENRTYETQDGDKRWVTELIADRISFAGDSSGREKPPLPDPSPNSKARDSQKPDEASDDAVPMPGDEDLPF